jgi:hypothetical protein
MDPSPSGRLAAYGHQLIDIHHDLRERLASLHAGAEASAPGLLEHCAAFCTALTRHHRAEDGTAFPMLARKHPELRPVLDELEHDHETVADILRRLDTVLASAAELGPIRVRSELDGLTALLESHFVYEEKKLVGALNALEAGGDILGAP